VSGVEPVYLAAGLIADAGLKATALFAAGGVAALLLRGGSAAQRHAVWAATFAAIPLLVALVAARGPLIAVEAPWLVAVWLIGALVASLPLVRGGMALRRLWRRARPVPHERGLFTSDELPGPLTWGLLRPVIVLPSAAMGWSAERREAALAHERAHIVRRDWAVHIGVWLVCILFWFHPLAWLARRALVCEAEQAADDAALALGVRPSAYAGLLVSLSSPAAHPGALGAGVSQVAVRVQAVLQDRSRSPRRGWVLTVALALGAGLTATLGPLTVWSPTPPPLTCSPETMP